jgi:hypothetical protein
MLKLLEVLEQLLDWLFLRLLIPKKNFGITEEMLQVSQTMSQVTPLELEILFLLVDLHKQSG